MSPGAVDSTLVVDDNRFHLVAEWAQCSVGLWMDPPTPSLPMAFLQDPSLSVCLDAVKAVNVSHSVIVPN